MKFVSKTAKGLLLEIYVQPRSSKSCVAGTFDGRLKIKLQAPPANDAANKECLKLLARLLGIPKSRLEIVSGRTNRRKRLLITWPQSQKPSAKAADELQRAVARLCTGK